MKSKAQRAALRARGIKPGKVTKTTPHGQATGGWSPFAPPAEERMAVVDDAEYEAFDRVKRVWFTHRPKR